MLLASKASHGEPLSGPAGRWLDELSENCPAAFAVPASGMHRGRAAGNQHRGRSARRSPLDSFAANNSRAMGAGRQSTSNGTEDAVFSCESFVP